MDWQVCGWSGANLGANIVSNFLLHFVEFSFIKIGCRQVFGVILFLILYLDKISLGGPNSVSSSFSIFRFYFPMYSSLIRSPLKMLLITSGSSVYSNYFCWKDLKPSSKYLMIACHRVTKVRTTQIVLNSSM